MICEEKNRLMHAYQTRTRLFSHAVDQLDVARSTAKKSAYIDLKRISEDARIDSEKARLELERHVYDHGC
jgi:hypothetical protein